MSAKPPLGIMPKHLWDEKRVDDLIHGMNRYIEARMPIPTEWVKEYNRLTKTKDPIEIFKPEGSA